MKRFQNFRPVIKTTVINIKSRGPGGVLNDAASNFHALKWCKVSSTNRSKETLVGSKNANGNHACNLGGAGGLGAAAGAGRAGESSWLCWWWSCGRAYKHIGEKLKPYEQSRLTTFRKERL